MKSITFSDKNYIGTILAALFHDLGKYEQKFKGNIKKHEELCEDLLKATSLDKSFNILNYLHKEGKKDTQYSLIVKLADWLSASERHNKNEEEKNKVQDSSLINILSELRLDKFNNLNPKPIRFNSNLLSLNPDFYYDINEGDGNLFTKFTNELKSVFEFLENSDNNSLDENISKVVIKLSLDLLKKYTFFSSSAYYYSRSDISLYAHSKLTAAIAAILYQLYSNGLIELKSLEKDLNLLFNKRKDLDSMDNDDFINFIREKLSEQILDPKLLIIRGNFSGIQNFVSLVYDKDALKMFKARSTYLSLLNHLIPIKIVEILSLPITNIVYSGGGNFEILAPNIQEYYKILKSFVDSVNESLWNLFNGTLFLELTLTKAPLISFYKKFYPFVFNINQFSNDNEKLSEENKAFIKERVITSRDDSTLALSSKHRKFYTTIGKIIKKNNSFLDDGIFIDENSKYKICKICHKSFLSYSSNDNSVEEEKFEDRSKEYCNECNVFLTFRKFIRDLQRGNNFSNLIKKYKKSLNTLFTFDHYNLLEFWKTIAFYKGNLNFTTLEIPFEILPLGFPLNDEKEIIEFSDLVKQSEGINRLAALKLDVDNLGSLFSRSYILDDDATSKDDEDNNKIPITFSRYLQISEMLSLFFSGIVDKLREKQEYNQKIYIVFSGGDDAFFIGPWNTIISFAIDLYNLFKFYVGNNPCINISASIYIFEEKYPVAFVHQKVEDLLEFVKRPSESKKINRQKNKKNKLNLEGLVISWKNIYNFDRELRKVFIYGKNNTQRYNYGLSDYLDRAIDLLNKDEIDELDLFFTLVNLFFFLLKDKHLSRSSLSNLYFLSSSAISVIKQNNRTMVNVPKVWLIRYSLSRNLHAEGKIYDNLLTKLWSVFNLYFSRAIIGNFNINILPYSLKFVLSLLKENKENNDKD